MMAQLKESRKRSLVKALSWRLIAMLITMVVSYFVITEDKVSAGLTTAVVIGFLDSAVKIFAYYGHERLWLRLDFGSSSKPEYEI